MMSRPKLKDKIYGELFWEEWDEDESYWYAPMTDETGNTFSLFIRADSQMDFMVARKTHTTYQNLLENINSIRDKTVDEIMENSRRLLKKKRHRNAAGEVIKNNLKLDSIKIYSDLSSEVEFIGIVAEDEDPDETFYALIDPKGNLTEAGIEEF